MQEENGPAGCTTYLSPGFHVSSNSSKSVGVDSNGSPISLSDYFRTGTSRIGFSFEHSSSGSSLQRHRPCFGFGPIRSPQKQPVAVVTAVLRKDEVNDQVTFHFSSLYVFCQGLKHAAHSHLKN